jgi:hypothetical protein
MSKRRRTNGNLDLYPNFMSGRVTLSAANTYTTVTVNTPIPRLKTTQGRATVMELLWCDFYIDTIDLIGNGDAVQFQMSIGSVPTGVLFTNDTRTVFNAAWEVGFVTSGMSYYQRHHRWDFQSQDGYGYLLAADSFHMSGASAGQAAANVFDWKLYYRFVDIPLSEFVGIVQSTQQ